METQSWNICSSLGLNVYKGTHLFWGGCFLHIDCISFKAITLSSSPSTILFQGSFILHGFYNIHEQHTWNDKYPNSLIKLQKIFLGF